MKIIAFCLSTMLLGAALQPLCASAAEEHQHEKKVKGPNGGRVVTTPKFKYELLVTAEKKIKVTFLGDDYKPIASSGQAVSAVCGDRSKPTKMTFVADGSALISEQTLPEGNNTACVVQIKPQGEDKPVTERLNLNLADCPKCSSKEYACTCVHDTCEH